MRSNIVSLYSVDGDKATLLVAGIRVNPTKWPGFLISQDSKRIEITYVVRKEPVVDFLPAGLYRLILKAGTIPDKAGNTNDEIIYNFSSAGGVSLDLYDSNIRTALVYEDSLLSTDAKNLTVKFNKAIKLPAGKKKQVFIEKKTGSSWNVVLNADGDFSAAVGTDEKNLVLSTRNNLAAGTYRLRVELEAVQAKSSNEYLFERVYTSEVTK